MRIKHIWLYCVVNLAFIPNNSRYGIERSSDFRKGMARALSCMLVNFRYIVQWIRLSAFRKCCWLFEVFVWVHFCLTIISSVEMWDTQPVGRERKIRIPHQNLLRLYFFDSVGICNVFVSTDYTISRIRFQTLSLKLHLCREFCCCFFAKTKHKLRADTLQLNMYSYAH